MKVNFNIKKTLMSNISNKISYLSQMKTIYFGNTPIKGLANINETFIAKKSNNIKFNFNSIYSKNLSIKHFSSSGIRILSTSIDEPSPTESYETENIRNIGIIAHIDAGKTTTTERILLYSGIINSAGEVHDGNTVTDYLQQERDRGITIRAAAVSVKWKDTQINIIDTPGHIDFTAEVERSLRVMDSAIILFDGSMGVETQTITVWNQAAKYELPTIAFINKIDKMGANIATTLYEMSKKLRCNPVLITYPIGEEHNIKGIVDLISMTYVTYSGKNGRIMKTIDIFKSEDCESYIDTIMKLRETLLEELSNHNDELMNYILEEKEIPIDIIIDAVKYCVVNKKLLITLCGSSLKNKGVQQLIDSVVAFMPSPLETKETKLNKLLSEEKKKVLADKKIDKESAKDNIDIVEDLGKDNKQIDEDENENEKLNEEDKVINDKKEEIETEIIHRKISPSIINSSVNNKTTDTSKDKEDKSPIGFIFKIINDNNLGNLCYFKLYFGELKKGTQIKFSNPHLVNKTEKVIQILRVKADECLQLEKMQAGDIGALVGLKHLESGTTFISENSQNLLYLDPIFIPEPVFFCSIYSRSNSNTSNLLRVLQQLSIEDPSLRMKKDTETGQTVVSGLGELHLEIIKDRIEIDYGIKTLLGKMKVSFRESIKSSSEIKHILDKEFNKQPLYFEIELSCEPLPKDYEHDYNSETSKLEYYDKETNCLIVKEFENQERDTRVIFNHEIKQEDVFKTINQLKYIFKRELIYFVSESLKSGVLLGYPLHNIKVSIDNGYYNTRKTNSVAMKMCVIEAFKLLIKDSTPSLLEPFMLVETTCANMFSNTIIDEINHRKGIIDSVVTELRVSEDQIKNSKFNYSYLLEEQKELVNKTNKDQDKEIQTTIKSFIPLTEMIGYSAYIRSVTKGEASYYMEYHNFDFASSALEEKVISGEYFYE